MMTAQTESRKLDLFTIKRGMNEVVGRDEWLAAGGGAGAGRGEF